MKLCDRPQTLVASFFPPLLSLASLASLVVIIKSSNSNKPVCSQPYDSQVICLNAVQEAVLIDETIILIIHTTSENLFLSLSVFPEKFMCTYPKS